MGRDEKTENGPGTPQIHRGSGQRADLRRTGRDRKIVYALTSGERTKAVAERFGLSEGRVSQLRRKFEQLWRTFQGDAEEAA
ncbi:MAG: helix-turn-helix domain-containing protein [Tepidisphaeraceae bacterium]